MNEPTIPLPPAQPPRKHHRIRNTAIGAGAVIIAVVAFSAVASSHSTPANPASTGTPAPQPTGLATVPAATIPTAPAATALPTCTAITTWALNGGSANVNAVSTDLTQMNTDTSDGNVIAVEGADAEQLAVDAGTAASDPVPGSARDDYVTAMRDYEQAANDLTLDNLTDATAQLQAANPLVQDATAAIAVCNNS